MCVCLCRVYVCRSAFKNLKGTSVGKRHLRRYRRRWEGNIRIDIKEIDIKEIYINMRRWLIRLWVGIAREPL